MECLLITTKDKRKFFTRKENYPQLLWFLKIFNAEASLVNVDDAKVMELSELAPAFCDSEYSHKKFDYKLLETMLSNRRKDILNTSRRIRSFIIQSFLAGEIVSISRLRLKFDKVTSACLCNHIRLAKMELQGKGCHVAKVGGGEYKLEQL